MFAKNRPDRQKMQAKAFGGRALPGHAGELKRSPRPPSRNQGVLLLRGAEGGKG